MIGLHFNLGDVWPIYAIIVMVVVAFTWISLTAINKNEITRIQLSRKHTSFWIETKKK
jgi:hypothetical protein